MSHSTALAVMPDRRPVELREFYNAFGWGASIWGRLCRHHGLGDPFGPHAFLHPGLDKLWRLIDNLPEWQQIPLVLTFDTGVIPIAVFDKAADLLDEFDRRLPAPEGHVNHVPAVAELLRSGPEAPLFGMHVTSVTENPFDPWDEEADAPGSGCALDVMYVLPQHREVVVSMFVRSNY